MRFSPHMRSKIINTVARDGMWTATFHKIRYAIYRGDGQIILVIKQGRKWGESIRPTVWAALEAVEQEARGVPSGHMANAGQSVDARERMAG